MHADKNMNQNKKWYKTWWGVLIILCFLPFFLTYWIWKRSWKLWLRIGVISVFWVLIILIGSSSGTPQVKKEKAQSTNLQLSSPDSKTESLTLIWTSKLKNIQDIGFFKSDGQNLYFAGKETEQYYYYAFDVKTQKILWKAKPEKKDYYFQPLDPLVEKNTFIDNLILLESWPSDTNRRLITHIEALDKKTGRVVWSNNEDNIETPVIYNQFVFFTKFEGKEAFSCLINGKTGEEKWKTSIDSGGLQETPIIKNDTIYIIDSKAEGWEFYPLLRALDLETGKEKWRFSSRAVSIRDLYPLRKNILITTQEKDLTSLILLDANNGKEKWRKEFNSEKLFPGIKVISVNDENKEIYLSKDNFFSVLDLDTGEQKFEKATVSVNNMTWDEKSLYLNTFNQDSDSNFVVALNIINKNEQWSFKDNQLDRRGMASWEELKITDRYLFIGIKYVVLPKLGEPRLLDTGYIYIIDKETGEEVIKIDASANGVSSFILFSDIFIFDKKGEINAYKL